jgi:uncharacterized protein
VGSGIEIREAHFPGPVGDRRVWQWRFPFADMSHRGSILCLPSGIYGWDAWKTGLLDTALFDRVLAESGDIEFLLVGTGHVDSPTADRI